VATAVIEYPGRSTTFDGFGAGHVVCANTEVTGTEIKTEATIKAATDTPPQLFVFAERWTQGRANSTSPSLS
jgi:hypothetical protein